jgi:hypothetical protein
VPAGIQVLGQRFCRRLRAFFGRAEEGEELYLRVLSVPLLVQFGKSGLGKTSLLQASLFPRLRQKSFLPVMVRLNVVDETLTLAVARSIEQACKAEGLELPEVRKEGLWELLSTALVWRDNLLLTLVLVFDQFEEIFTLRDATFRGELAIELGALVTGIAPERLRRGRAGAPERFAARPDVKILISLREDYLGALEEFSAAIPSLFHERLRLNPLTEDEAQAAITRPAQLMRGPREEPCWTPPFNFDPSALNDIIAYLKGKSGVIEPFQLQLVCRHAEAVAYSKAGKHEQPINLMPADFAEGKDFSLVLGNFYHDTLNKLPSSLRDKAEELCEHGLIDRDGHRLLLEGRQIRRDFGVEAETLNFLAQERLVRREPRLESVFYEISHDRLADSIFASRGNRLPKKERQRIRNLQVINRVISVLSAVMLVLSVVAVIFYFRAEAETRKAKEAESRVAAEKERADGELKKAQTTQSQFLAALARRERAEGDAATAILLALEALPDDTAGIARPYIPEPEAQLDGAWRDLRERFVLNRHEDGVYSAAFSPDGKRIVTASADNTARLWNAETGTPIGEALKGHADYVLSAAFSPDGKRIVTASADKTARLWNAATGKPIGEPLKGHEDGVYRVAFSPDGKRIVTASADKTARLWDAATGTPIDEPLKGHENSVMSAAPASRSASL